MAWSLTPVIENLRWGHILTEEQIKICYEDNLFILIHQCTLVSMARLLLPYILR